MSSCHITTEHQTIIIDIATVTKPFIATIFVTQHDGRHRVVKIQADHLFQQILGLVDGDHQDSFQRFLVSALIETTTPPSHNVIVKQVDDSSAADVHLAVFGELEYQDTVHYEDGTSFVSVALSGIRSETWHYAAKQRGFLRTQRGQHCLPGWRHTATGGTVVVSDEEMYAKLLTAIAGGSRA